MCCHVGGGRGVERHQVSGGYNNGGSWELSENSMGDSGVFILREGKILWSAEPLTHYFNCPKQLSKIPAGMSGVVTDSLDDPSAYDTFSHQLLPGDVVLLYVRIAFL